MVDKLDGLLLKFLGLGESWLMCAWVMVLGLVLDLVGLGLAWSISAVGSVFEVTQIRYGFGRYPIGLS